jgi:hypothetical protein
MKISVLAKDNNQKSKVDLYLVKNIDLPFSTILTHHIIPIDVDENVDEEEPGFNSFFSSKEIDYFKFKLKLKKYKNFVRGMIVYKNYDDLADFLINDYIPSGSYLVDKLLINTKELPAKRRKQIIKEELIKYKNSLLENKDFRIEESKKTFLPALSEKELVQKENLNILNLYKEEILVQVARRYREIFITIAIENNKEMSNKQIPVFEKMIMIAAEFNESFSMIYFDEKNYKIDSHLRSISAIISFLGKGTYNEFDKYGKFIYPLREEALIPFDFKPEFILCIPPKKELRQYLLKKKLQEFKLPSWFTKSYFVYNALYANRVLDEYKNNIKIVDSPEEVIPILARTINNIVYPTETPTENILLNNCSSTPKYLIYGGIK